MDALIALGKIGIALFLVFLNGFFVAAEFAIVKVRTTQIEPLAEKGIGRAIIARYLVQNLDTYLSACQLGITLASLGLGWVGEPFVAQLVAPVLGWVGITQPTVVSTVSFGIAFSIITALHIVLGELAPKSLAILKPQMTTLAVARPLHLFYRMFRPVISGLNSTANALLKMAGLGTVTEGEQAHSEAELRILLTHGETLSSTGKTILLRAMDLKARTAKEVMVPRTEIVFLSTKETLEENISAALENQYTRYPLCEGDIDNVIGMVHLRDLFQSYSSKNEDEFNKVVRQIPVVLETTHLEHILNIFLAKRVHMAVVVDEYGGTAGLVTLENILEELVGEIRDEFDIEPEMVTKVNSREYRVSGAMPLHDFSRMFGFKPESIEFVTVSGYAVYKLDRLPEKGATFTMGDWTCSVDTIEGSRVKFLRVYRREARPTDDIVEI